MNYYLSSSLLYINVASKSWPIYLPFSSLFRLFALLSTTGDSSEELSGHAQFFVSET